MSPERRRFARQACALPVELEERGQSVVRMVTADISRHGAFVLTDSPRRADEQLRLRFDLGGHGHIEVMAQVARQAAPSEDSSSGPGMGVDFCALSGDAKERWDTFVQNLAGEDRPGTSAPEEAQRPLRRQHPRHRSCFLVRLREKDNLRDFYTRDIGAGGMFLSTPTPDDTAREVQVVLVHPQSEQEYPLTAQVVRVANSDSSPERGVAIAFARRSISEEVALLAFIETGVNYLDAYDGQQQGHDHLKASVGLSPRDPSTTVELGEALLASGDAQLAINAYRSALTIDPGCSAAHYGLYRACEALQQHERAAEHLATFHQLVASQDG